MKTINYVLLCVLCGMIIGCQSTTTPITPRPTRESDRIIPTPTFITNPISTPAQLLQPISTLIPLDESQKAIINTADFDRFGVSGTIRDASLAYDSGLWFRHFFSWNYAFETNLPNEVTFWQMIRVNDRDYPWDWDKLNEVINANLGAYWMIGNEPDVRWQDNVTPKQYAVRYHEAYTAIKAADPTAKIVAGSISQGTPIRLRWLDEVLVAYQNAYGVEMPVDIWSIHAYVLREERDSWGVDIPPGLDDISTGELYEISDHDDLDLFIKNLLQFREWMATNGYDVPMAVTEFGILLPNDYGFPEDTVKEYMHDSLDLLRTTKADSGYSADNNRIAQFWFWYIIEDRQTYHTGSLYNSAISEPTYLGEAWIEYLTTQP